MLAQFRHEQGKRTIDLQGTRGPFDLIANEILGLVCSCAMPTITSRLYANGHYGRCDSSMQKLIETRILNAAFALGWYGIDYAHWHREAAHESFWRIG